MKISSQAVKIDAEAWRRLPSVEMDKFGKTGVVPHSLVQETYARLNNVYAQSLCDNWAEEAEPAKHVFEDLAIAAFVIELWRSLYGIPPKCEVSNPFNAVEFPGFVDMACGNGVLVYVLLMEGYSGVGFDARRRTSWKNFPEFIQNCLMEKVFIPKQFIDVLEPDDLGVNAELGDYPKDTFIISKHADELTVWTPLMAALACTESPLPFLAIPCCSHSLAGARYRYPPQQEGSQNNQSVEQNPQPASGDLRAFRLMRQKEKTEQGMSTSMYGALNMKTMGIAKEVGYDVKRNKLQIPSTRDMAIIGKQKEKVDHEGLQQKVMEIVQRECEQDGGVRAAAKNWIERARNLHVGIGEDNSIH